MIPHRVRVIEVIEVVTVTGEGTSFSPVRELFSYFTMAGDLLTEHDTWKLDDEERFGDG